MYCTSLYALEERQRHFRHLSITWFIYVTENFLISCFLSFQLAEGETVAAIPEEEVAATDAAAAEGVDQQQPEAAQEGEAAPAEAAQQAEQVAAV